MLTWKVRREMSQTDGDYGDTKFTERTLLGNYILHFLFFDEFQIFITRELGWSWVSVLTGPRLGREVFILFVSPVIPDPSCRGWPGRIMDKIAFGRRDVVIV